MREEVCEFCETTDPEEVLIRILSLATSLNNSSNTARVRIVSCSESVLILPVRLIRNPATLEVGLDKVPGVLDTLVIGLVVVLHPGVHLSPKIVGRLTKPLLVSTHLMALSRSPFRAKAAIPAPI